MLDDVGGNAANPTGPSQSLNPDFAFIQELLDENPLNSRDLAKMLKDKYGSRARDVIGKPVGISNYPPVTDELELLSWLMDERFEELSNGSFIKMLDAWTTESWIERSEPNWAAHGNPAASFRSYFTKQLNKGSESYDMESNLNKRELYILQYIGNKGMYSSIDWVELNEYLRNKQELKPVSQARLSQLISALLEKNYLIKEISDSNHRIVKLREGAEKILDNISKMNKNINANSPWSQDEKDYLQKLHKKEVKIVDIADELGRTQSSVSSMLKRLLRDVDDDRHEFYLWRKNKAKHEKIPAFHILHDKTIQRILNLPYPPKSFVQLLRIKHVGWHTVKTYGNEILEVVNRDNPKKVEYDIDREIQGLEAYFLKNLQLQGRKGYHWDELEGEEQFHLLKKMGAKTKAQLRSRFEMAIVELKEKVLDGILKEGYKLEEISEYPDKWNHTFEVASAKIKGSRRLYYVRPITSRKKKHKDWSK